MPYKPTETMQTRFSPKKSADSVYRPSKGAQAVSELVSDENGKIVRGLDAGSYILKETKAPAGFSLPENPETLVVLTDDYAVKENQPAEAGMDGLLEITETETDAEGNETEKVVYTDSAVLSVTVEDPPGLILPLTGGSGSGVFLWFGTVLLILSMTALIIMKTSKRGFNETES